MNGTDGGFRRQAWRAALLCALAGFAVFQFWGNATRGYIATRSLFWWWGSQWFDPAAGSEHGLLVTALAAWLLWRAVRGGERGRNADGEMQGRALAAMVGGLGLHALGYAMQQTRISIAATLLFAWGAVSLGGGRRWSRAALFPLAFMLLAMPLNVFDGLGFQMRLGISAVAQAAARVVGIDVVRNGTLLFSPRGGYQYDIAAACSGVRSLVALAAVSLVLGYLTFCSWRRRMLVAVLSLPFAFAGNVLRIFAIIAAAEGIGQKAGLRVHDGSGFVVFAVVLGLQFAAVEALKRFWPEPAPKSAGEAVAQPAGALEAAPSGFLTGAWNVAIAVVAAAGIAAGALAWCDARQTAPNAGVLLAADRRNPVPLPDLPGGEWIGLDVSISAVEREILPPDTGFARKGYVSRRDRRRQVLVSVVLSGRDRSSIHRPEMCLVGQGWTIRDSAVRTFDYPGGGKGLIPATVLRVEHEALAAGGRRQTVPAVVAYWFAGPDRIVATNWERMGWGAFDQLRHFRGDRWAYVLVQTQAMDGEAAALERIQAVLNWVLPAFQKPPPGARLAPAGP